MNVSYFSFMVDFVYLRELPYILSTLDQLFNKMNFGRIEALHDIAHVLIHGISKSSIQMMRKRIKKRGDKVSIIWDGGQRTYLELFERSLFLAHSLLDMGIRPGDKLGFMSINAPCAPEVWSVCNMLGLSFIPINWRLKSGELKYILENSGCNALIYGEEVDKEVQKTQYNLSFKLKIGNEYENLIYETKKELRRLGAISVDDISSSLEARFANILKQRRARSEKEKGMGNEKLEGEKGDKNPQIIIYTSGTTGKPKGAQRRLTPTRALLYIGMVVREFGFSASDVHLVVCPLYHSAPLFFAQLYLLLGGTLVILPRFRIELFLSAIEKFRVNTTFIVPYMISEIFDTCGEIKPQAFRSLTHVICGAAPLSPHMKVEFVRRFGPVLYEFYGSTETGLNTILRPKDIPLKAESVGKVMPLHRIRIVDDKGNDCPPGKEGLIYIRSPFIMSGYYKNEEAMEECSLPGGYITAGDVGKLDEDGFLYILDRKKDMIISAGVNIYPAEIEAELVKHPAVKYAACVGIPDEKWGERVKAFVVLREGMRATEKELEEFLRERIASYKIPREWAFVSSLPMTPSGKVLKRELKNKM